MTTVTFQLWAEQVIQGYFRTFHQARIAADKLPAGTTFIIQQNEKILFRGHAKGDCK